MKLLKVECIITQDGSLVVKVLVKNIALYDYDKDEKKNPVINPMFQCLIESAQEDHVGRLIKKEGKSWRNLLGLFLGIFTSFHCVNKPVKQKACVLWPGACLRVELNRKNVLAHIFKALIGSIIYIYKCWLSNIPIKFIHINYIAMVLG